MERMSFNSYQMSFNGEVLERGFWLYVWQINSSIGKYVYVGRTGDSSSPNASSPFNRIGRHLDFRENAKGNSLAKRLKERGVNPQKSQFRMLALGPLFHEQETFEKHKPYRDQMATLEYELAQYLLGCGYDVLGVHHKLAAVSPAFFSEIKGKVSEFLLNEKKI